MSDKWLVAAFYIPRRERDLSLEDLLSRARARRMLGLTGADPSGLVDVEWAGLPLKVYLDHLPYHLVLQVYFRQSDFLEMADDDPDRHPIALAFREACEALSPEVAFIAVHLDLAERKHVLSSEWMVLARDANSLADQGYGLLYLDDDVSRHWTTSELVERESMSVSRGRLVFAGRGPFSRWF